MRSITLRNYRCIGDEPQTARLAPLTLLVGENSSGKTSLMAMVRALWDIAYDNRVPDFKQGPYDLGSFDEIAHHRGARGGRAKSFEAELETDSTGGKRNGASEGPLRFKTGGKRNGASEGPLRFRATFVAAGALHERDRKRLLGQPPVFPQRAGLFGLRDAARPTAPAAPRQLRWSRAGTSAACSSTAAASCASAGVIGPPARRSGSR